ncbi:MAG TPA: SPFH domain-containing protein [Aggregatilineales bacterium]|nr:SPFH domain-containing protein [Aggregatilineales bacterium]
MEELNQLIANSSIVIIILVVLFIFWLLTRLIRVVPETERLVVLSLGRYAGTRGPGIVIVIPVIEQARRVDIRESFLDIPSQTAITKDNAPIDIDFLVYYRVVDPKLAVLQVDNVVSAAVNIATTTLRAVLGDISLDDVLAKREQINDTLRLKLDEITERWGMKVTTVEIREIKPPREVQDAMNRQMTAERERRATVTRASGEREASIAVAEGDKQAAILKAEGVKQSSILTAEGERQAQLLRAQGFAASLQAIDAMAKDAGANTLMLQYLETLKTVGSSESTKFVIPLELMTMAQQVAGKIAASDSTSPGANSKSSE